MTDACRIRDASSLYVERKAIRMHFDIRQGALNELVLHTHIMSTNLCLLCVSNMYLNSVLGCCTNVVQSSKNTAICLALRCPIACSAYLSLVAVANMFFDIFTSVFLS